MFFVITCILNQVVSFQRKDKNKFLLYLQNVSCLKSECKSRKTVREINRKHTIIILQIN